MHLRGGFQLLLQPLSTEGFCVNPDRCCPLDALDDGATSVHCGTVMRSIGVDAVEHQCTACSMQAQQSISMYMPDANAPQTLYALRKQWSQCARRPQLFTGLQLVGCTGWAYWAPATVGVNSFAMSVSAACLVTGAQYAKLHCCIWCTQVTAYSTHRCIHNQPPVLSWHLVDVWMSVQQNKA